MRHLFTQKLTAKQCKVYLYFRGAGEPLRQRDVAKELGYSEEAYIYDSVSSLIKKGYMKRVTVNKITHYVAI